MPNPWKILVFRSLLHIPKSSHGCRSRLHRLRPRGRRRREADFRRAQVHRRGPGPRRPSTPSRRFRRDQLQPSRGRFRRHALAGSRRGCGRRRGARGALLPRQGWDREKRGEVVRQVRRIQHRLLRPLPQRGPGERHILLVYPKNSRPFSPDQTPSTPSLHAAR